MDPISLQNSAVALVNQLTESIDDPRALGFMSPAIYDTAWVSMIQKTVEDQSTWLFPQCFEYILQMQLDDGSWISYASQIDGILNTAASLLSLKRHFTVPLQIGTISQKDLSERIDRGTAALSSLLNSWNVELTVHVGFEILVPALLGYLEAENVTFCFPARSRLFEIRAEKLARFKPEFLYGPIQTTALHSLEAFIGIVDFDQLRHHKTEGSFMASPSSTAAVLMHASEWDQECEEYICHTIQHASGKGSGGVPSAFPSPIFEIGWTLSTLLKAGFDLDPEYLKPVHLACEYLNGALAKNNGIVGFTPYVCCDADDTAKSTLVLSLLQRNVSPDEMLKAFEAEHHFRTYPYERDPSFSANCNVLMALLHTKSPSQYMSQIEKAARFLLKYFRESDLNVRDKWNLSPFYSWMLMSQAIVRYNELCQASHFSPMDRHLQQNLVDLLQRMAIMVLCQQNSTGSWGSRDSKEETAYAVLVLTYAARLELADIRDEDMRRAIHDGCSFLNNNIVSGSEHLWVEKVTYGSEMLSSAYILAALKTAADLPSAEQEHESENSIVLNGVNGHHDSNGYHPAKIEPQFNYIEEIITNEHPINHGNDGIHTNGVDNESITLEIPPITNGIDLETKGNGFEHEKNEDLVSIHTTHVIELCYQSRGWTKVQEDILLGPFDYLESLPGKNIRSQFMQAFNVWLQVPAPHLKIIEKVISMLHTASLLVDDIEDNSVLRRGEPVAHSIFGEAQTFNSGNYIYFLALREVQKLNDPQAVQIYLDALVYLHRGQGMDVFWRDSLICPTESEYLEMVDNKTGALFCLAIELLQLSSPVELDLVPLVRLFGIIFQICDDYHNLKSTSYLQKKGLCEDLTEGKFSFPIIHSIRSNPANRQLMNILKKRSQDQDIKRYAVSYMEGTNTFEYTRQFVSGLNIQASNMIKELEDQGLGTNLEIRKILARMKLHEE
ncbi:Phyllocladan-16-alpha-ol synthase [Penicillium angulare]|uniref:Phyllocladan-16-alpha-ol synthase n=1 Tax=Penicillium angulare TaxID=116970 RepID=A0A9W9G8V3_9EURO|nr:Phyllocladan-16-alpha-ol synthase [Penicillium angulare]